MIGEIIFFIATILITMSCIWEIYKQEFEHKTKVAFFAGVVFGFFLTVGGAWMIKG